MKKPTSVTKREYTFELFGPGKWMQQNYPTLRLARRVAAMNMQYGFDQVKIYRHTTVLIPYEKASQKAIQT